MLNGMQPWHLIILVAVLILLFGFKRLPDASRSLARSMKIFKAETKGMRSKDKDDTDDDEVDAERRELTTSVKAERVDDSETETARLRRELDEMKKRAYKAESS